MRFDIRLELGFNLLVIYFKKIFNIYFELSRFPRINNYKNLRDKFPNNNTRDKILLFRSGLGCLLRFFFIIY